MRLAFILRRRWQIYEFSPGSTSESINVNLLDTNTANGKSGLTFADVSVSYTRMRQNAVAVTPLDLASPSAAWAAGGFKEVSSSLCRGDYRFDLPDAALAAGVPWVILHFEGSGFFDRAVLIFLRQPANNAGAGSVEYTVTVQKADTTPIAGAQVWVSTDAAGSNVIAGALTTDAFGQATFLLDPGSYFLWCADEGFSGTNPTTITVS